LLVLQGATVRIPRRDIEFEPLYEEDFVLVAAADWAARLPAQRIKREGARLFADVPLIAYATDLPITCPSFAAISSGFSIPGF
jgi:hypothetical protein